jgi:hypothetical protein
MWCVPELNAQYVERMEDVLELCIRSADRVLTSRGEPRIASAHET